MSPRIALPFALLLLACSSSPSNAPEPSADGGTDTSVDPLVVTTDKGPVRGTASGGATAFFDIPFAAAPTGALRFRPPQPRAPWTDVRDATKRGPACPQGVDPITKVKPTQSEDCLAVNIWTPKLDANAKAPVMVFFHGGAFTFGSGNLELYDGARLTKEGVVVVTVNYRLGPFGFLAHPALSAEDDKKVSGNVGILDQQAALRWVQANVARFGGDPGNVTIFGESAGAVSVCLHLIGEGSKGLFHRAISQSGTCALVSTPLRDPSSPGVEDSAEERGARFAKDVGCEGGDVLACLRSKPFELLVDKSAGGVAIGRREVGFTPNVDGVVVPAAPMLRLITGPANDVPYLVGTNGDEGTIFTNTTTIATKEQYEAAVRAMNPLLADKLLEIWPASAFPTPKAAYDALLGEALFVCPAREAARGTSARVPTFLYQFTHVTAIGASLGLGAFHASELWFVFGNWSGVLATPTAAERTLSDAMIGYWTRFAKTGDPNGNGAPSWPKYVTSKDEHQVLASPISTGSGLVKARCDALLKAVTGG